MPLPSLTQTAIVMTFVLLYKICKSKKEVSVINIIGWIYETLFGEPKSYQPISKKCKTKSQHIVN